MTAVEEILKDCDVSRFQKELADFIVSNNLKTIVETGAGISSLCILKAWDDAGIDGKLYSIDPAPWMAFKLKHPKWQLIKKKSIDAMKDLYVKTGEWDLFLHDGNHDILCQTYEYIFAFGCLKVGGWLCSDDTNWGNNGAWEKHLRSKGLEDKKIGSLLMVQNPYGSLNKTEAKLFHENTLLAAQTDEKNYLAAGGQLTPCFQ